MSVWLTIPSARPPAEVGKTLLEWYRKGYNLALWRDQQDNLSAAFKNDLERIFIIVGDYPGYAQAVNLLTRAVFARDPQCNWIVAGGDDTLPDPNHTPEGIALECSIYFAARAIGKTPDEAVNIFTNPELIRPMMKGSTFGVMQPTGDRWGDKNGAYIDRVAGSPWIGREFCKRMNQGLGPYHPGFQHMHVDECLQEVAIKLDVFWQRPDLIHKHEHWGQPKPGERFVTTDRMPEHVKKWNSPEHWKSSKELLSRLRAEDFKECMPL